jgi:exopolyphosphatase/guanosine-5'-triphosphate,3'-diphosphate pyrophosphatase
VVANGKASRTIAVESEDAEAVIRAVREPGRRHVNTSYRADSPQSSTTSPSVAVIDAGTNSIKFHIGERASDGKWRASATARR